MNNSDISVDLVDDDSECWAGAGAPGGGRHLQAQGQEGGPEEEERLRGEGSQIHPTFLQTSNFLLSLQRLHLVSGLVWLNGYLRLNVDPSKDLRKDTVKAEQIPEIYTIFSLTWAFIINDACNFVDFHMTEPCLSCVFSESV